MVWKSHPHTLISNWLGLIEPVRCKSYSSGRRRGPATPGRIRSHPRVGNCSIHIQIQQSGDEKRDPTDRHRPTWCGNLTPLHFADWLGLIEPARSESCPPGRRRGPTAPRENKLPSPGQKKSLHTSTTPTARGRKQ